MAGDPEPTEGDEDTLVIPGKRTWQDTFREFAAAACLVLYAVCATSRKSPGPCAWNELIFSGGLIISVVVSAILWNYTHLVQIHKPFVFDRRTDQLRHGNKVHCRLSEIRQVQISHFSHEAGDYYGPEIVRRTRAASTSARSSISPRRTWRLSSSGRSRPSSSCRSPNCRSHQTRPSLAIPRHPSASGTGSWTGEDPL